MSFGTTSPPSPLVDEFSTVYFQTYKLAYDLAKWAERAFGEELGIDNPTTSRSAIGTA